MKEALVFRALYVTAAGNDVCGRIAAADWESALKRALAEIDKWPSLDGASLERLEVAA